MPLVWPDEYTAEILKSRGKTGIQLLVYGGLMNFISTAP